MKTTNNMEWTDFHGDDLNHIPFMKANGITMQKYYLIYYAYDDFSSFGKDPKFITDSEELAVDYCMKQNEADGFDWIDREHLIENPNECSVGYFYMPIQSLNVIN